MKLFPSILVLPSAYLAYGEALAPEAQQPLAKKLRKPNALNVDR